MAKSRDDHQSTVELAAELFAQLGYDGCRDLREQMRLRMAAHRQMVAAEREANGMTRPRSQRRLTKSAQAAQLIGGCSESSLDRSKAIEKWAPHLLPAVAAGDVSLWAAYKQATQLRDQASIRQAQERSSADAS